MWLFSVRDIILGGGLNNRSVLKIQLIALLKYWFAAAFIAPTQQLTSLEFFDECCIFAVIWKHKFLRSLISVDLKRFHYSYLARLWWSVLSPLCLWNFNSVENAIWINFDLCKVRDLWARKLRLQILRLIVLREIRHVINFLWCNWSNKLCMLSRFTFGGLCWHH
jgi:hypothetical protein